MEQNNKYSIITIIGDYYENRLHFSNFVCLQVPESYCDFSQGCVNCVFFWDGSYWCESLLLEESEVFMQNKYKLLQEKR